MQKGEVIKIMRRHERRLRAFQVVALRLFGSLARGEGRPGSDVDLLVDFAGPPSFDQYMELKFFLEDVLGRKVDLVTRNALKPALRRQIEKEAVRIA